MTDEQELQRELSSIRQYVCEHKLSAADLHELFMAGLVASVVNKTPLGARLPRAKELPCPSK